MNILTISFAVCFTVVAIVTNLCDSGKPEYSWGIYHKSSFMSCVRRNSHHHHIEVLYRVLQCFTSAWYNCLHQENVLGNRFNASKRCHKLHLMPPVLLTEEMKRYVIGIQGQTGYTINVTFITFRMEKTPFGCQRNKVLIIDGDNQKEFCGVRDQWSEYSISQMVKLLFFVFGVGSYFQVELHSMILEVVPGANRYVMNPIEEVQIYRGSPRTVNFTVDQLLTFWDPVQVYCLLFFWFVSSSIVFYSNINVAKTAIF